jgi:methyl-accepting chemotaxis protein-1 (serine sensor receptor)
VDRFKISIKLGMLVAVLFLITALIGVLGLEGMAREQQRMGTVYKDRTVALAQLSGVLYDTLSIRRQVDVALGGGSPDHIASALDEVARVDLSREAYWHSYLSSRMTAEELQLVQHPLNSLIK